MAGGTRGRESGFDGLLRAGIKMALSSVMSRPLWATGVLLLLVALHLAAESGAARCEFLCSRENLRDKCERCMSRVPMRFGKRAGNEAETEAAFGGARERFLAGWNDKTIAERHEINRLLDTETESENQDGVEAEEQLWERTENNKDKESNAWVCYPRNRGHVLYV